MAGSVGNVVNVVDLLQKHHPETVRFLLLSTHYRSPIEYSEERLDEVAQACEGFYRFFERYERITGRDFYDRHGRAGADAFTADRRQHRLARGRQPTLASVSASAWTTTSTPAAPSACCTSC